jgi:hypothetical protein
MHATASASRSVASPSTVKTPQHHKKRASQQQSKHAKKANLYGPLQRTPIQTPKMPKQKNLEVVRGLRDTWSSCCSSRCTCPRTMSRHCLMRMRQCTTSSSTCTQQHQHHAASPAHPPSKHHSTTKSARRNRKASTRKRKNLLSRLLQRTPIQTPTMHQLNCAEVARGLRDTWSSCCSSRCTCPRTMSRLNLMRMRQCTTSSSTCTQQHQHRAASPARPPTTRHSTTKSARRNRKSSTRLCHAPLYPPAKNTNPDPNDAPARKFRDCPRPAGYVVQLLLVALYMSTYAERTLPDAHTSVHYQVLHKQVTASASRSVASPSAFNKPQHHKKRASQPQSKHAKKEKPAFQPPAKNTNPDPNDAPANEPRGCPRPAGYAVQLLLVALYMSTYDE